MVQTAAEYIAINGWRINLKIGLTCVNGILVLSI